MSRTVLAVFDLDGTLIDSRRDLADSANEMLAGYGAPPLAENDIVGMIGCGAATLVERVMTAAAIDAPLGEALDRFLDIYNYRLTGYTRPYEGVPRMLEDVRARDVAVALLTNKPREHSVKILEAFDLAKYFRWVVGGDGPWPRKPAPDAMRFLMRQASAGPSETILVGDSRVDLHTARNAGVRVCLARYGFGYADVPVDELTGAETLVDRPSEITGVMHVRR
jgi:phosphoglycolate phosphatase